MKAFYIVLLSVLFFSCSSDREVKKMTDKGFQYIVEKYLNEYDAEVSILKEELSDAEILNQTQNLDSLSILKTKEVLSNYLKFVSSEKNIKMIKSGLAKKESLKEEQIARLEKMLREAQTK